MDACPLHTWTSYGPVDVANDPPKAQAPVALLQLSASNQLATFPRVAKGVLQPDRCHRRPQPGRQPPVNDATTSKRLPLDRKRRALLVIANL
ncbi:hypothetical protein BHE74_00054742 [Ensete ventricosum]|nr:hypothetical protein BHE74_00054742 [Ensete ventricosum]RZS26832.1 hypothetical protein BHM03_00060230 [Ensete ventricosum]